MSNSASVSRTVVIRTSRDTLGLVAAASAMTFAMAYAVHTKHDRPAPAPLQAEETQPPAPQPQQEWAGHLAELVPATAVTPSEPMSSATLVVPKAQLALPPLPKASTKPMRPCPPETSCVPIAKATASPPRRQLAATGEKANAADRPRKNLIGMLNPLNHLPDMSAVGRPFAYAGGAVAGWFKRL